ncbi:DNA-binding protein [Vibrio jasicida]|uniref:DNA-binding protein n=1 Tax=Vibrio jasicida TaxID=766224 RepID=UPI0015E1E2A9|nr:DNA-binding protein [Vibrio jasicida]
MTWFIAKDLAALPGMPKLLTSVSRKANIEGWEKRPVKGCKGKAFEYHIDSLPAETQKHLRNVEAKKQLTEVVEKFDLDEVLKRKAAEAKQKGEDDLKALMSIDPEHRKKAIIRAGLVDEYLRFKNGNKLSRGSNAMEMFVDSVRNLKHPYAIEHQDVIDMKRISTQIIYRWIRELNNKGTIALALEHNKAQPKIGKSLIRDQPELEEFIVAVMVEYPTTTARKMQTILKARYEGKYRIPERTTIRNFMAAWKEKNANHFTYMTNPDKWRNEFMSAFGSASERVADLNDLWELDATPGDIECVWEGNRKRVHLSGVIDVYSRRLHLLVTETPRTEANALLMRKALLDWGKPVTCKTDNGSDYVSKRMMKTFDNLDIEQELCTPFHPQEKPHIERAFRTFSHDWLEMMPGYVGHNVAERKGIEARKSFAMRLMQRGDVIEARMTPQELQEFCDKWLEIYHHREHSALGCSPFQQATSWKGIIERIPNERALDMLLSEPAGGNGIRKVSKKGVKVDNIWYVAAELTVGDSVYVYYDENDLGKLVVYNDDHEFLCIAEAPEYTGVSRRDIASMMKRLQKQKAQDAAQLARESRQKHDIRNLASEVMDYELEKSRNIAAFPQREEMFTSSTLEAGSQAHDALVNFDKPVKGSEMSAEEAELLTKQIIEFQSNNREAQREDETEEGKFKRWIELEEKEQAGEVLDEMNAHWKAQYETQPGYRDRKMIYDEWGKKFFFSQK